MSATPSNTVPTTGRLTQILLFAFCLLVTHAFSADAQTNSWINTGVQFDFSVPGARSLALGGAFVAVADDATAVVSNPAGLTTLLRPEVSVEGRFWRFVSLTPLRGNAFGTATNVGVDTISDIVDGSTHDSAGGLSFVSAVVPRGRLALAFYRQEQARFRANILSEGVFITTNAQGGQDRLDPFTASMSLDIVNYGVSAAYRFPVGLAIGGGIALSDFSIDTQTNGFYFQQPVFSLAPADRGRFVGLGQAYGPANFAEANRQSRVVETGDDTGAAVNLGALFRPPNSKWTVGGAARLGGKFQYDATATWGPAAAQFGTVTNGQVLDQDVVKYKVPDAYSAGVSFRPSDRLLFAAQYDRVRFSQLSSDVQEVFGQTGDVEQEFKKGLHFPDSNQARFGAEYAMVSTGRVIALRMGTAYESDHRMFYERFGQIRYQRIEVLFRPGEGQWHVTPGFGVAFPKFQIDSAFDFSDRSQTLSWSAAYRF